MAELQEARRAQGWEGAGALPAPPEDSTRAQRSGLQGFCALDLCWAEAVATGSYPAAQATRSSVCMEPNAFL